MKNLIIQKGSTRQFEIDLDKLPEKFLVGSAYAHVILDDRKVSLPHLEIEVKNGSFSVEDRNSVFGTFLNDQEISEKTLFQEGDVITLGEHTLTIQDVVIEKPPQSEKKETTTASTHELSFVAPATCKLVAIQGPLKNRSFPLRPAVTKIGRHQQSNDIVINRTNQGTPDKSISRNHAEITKEQGEYFLRDNDSGNGTMLNGKRLGKDEKRKLSEGDRIEIVSSFDSSIFVFRKPGNGSKPKAIATQPLSKTELLGTHPQKVPLQRNSRGSFAAGASIFVFVAGLLLLAFALFFRPNELDSLEVVATETIRLERSAATMAPQPSERILPSPALLDLNGDQSPELIFVKHDGTLTGFDMMARKFVPLLSHDGRMIETEFSPVLADLFGDGQYEILVSGLDSRVYLLEKQEAGYAAHLSKPLNGLLNSLPASGKVNDDDSDDVAVVVNDGFDQYLYVGLANRHLNRFNWLRQALTAKCRSTPSIYNAKIFLGNDNSEILVFEFQGAGLELIDRLQIKNMKDRSIRSFCVHSDDGGTRIYGRSSRGSVFVCDLTKSKSEIVNDLPEPGIQYPRLGASPLVANVNRDENPELIFAYVGGLAIYHLDETELPQPEPVHLPRRDRILSTPALIDLTRDGTPEIIFASFNETLYGKNGSLKIFDGETKKSKEILSLDSASFQGTPLIADIDGDEKLEIVALDTQHNLHLISTAVESPRFASLWPQQQPLANVATEKYVRTSAPNYWLWLSLIILLATLGFWVWKYWLVRQ